MGRSKGNSLVLEATKDDCLALNGTGINRLGLLVNQRPSNRYLSLQPDVCFLERDIRFLERGIRFLELGKNSETRGLLPLVSYRLITGV